MWRCFLSSPRVQSGATVLYFQLFAFDGNRDLCLVGRGMGPGGNCSRGRMSAARGWVGCLWFGRLWAWGLGGGAWGLAILCGRYWVSLVWGALVGVAEAAVICGLSVGLVHGDAAVSGVAGLRSFAGCVGLRVVFCSVMRARRAFGFRLLGFLAVLAICAY